MKNALIVTTVGGFLPQFLTNDVKILKDSGFLIHYASNFNNRIYEFSKEQMEREGIILHTLNIQKKPHHIFKNAHAIFRLVHIIRDEKIDLIHLHNPLGGFCGRLAACFSGNHPRIVYTTHGFHFFQGAPFYYLPFYLTERFLSRFTDVIITINHEDYACAKTFPMRSGGRVAMIPGIGLDTEKFASRPDERAAMRKRLHIPDDAFHIVSAGELNANKNHRIIIEAIKRLKDEEKTDRAIYYTICGSGKGEKSLRKQIQRAGLCDVVRLLGFRDDMERILQSADCFAFPSYREGFGMAALEALGCGIPVVASKNRGTKEYMQNMVNGVFCDANDADSFAEAIRKLRDTPNMCRTLGYNGIKTVRYFSKEASEEALRMAYGELPEQ